MCWDPREVSFGIIDMNDQAIHDKVSVIGGDLDFVVTYVYAELKYMDRRSLWADVVSKNAQPLDTPWIIMEDFNAIRDASYRRGGTSKWLPSFDKFRQCIEAAGVEDLGYRGCRYTWSNRVQGDKVVCRKLDRVLHNGKWLMDFTSSKTDFHTTRVSDHSPVPVSMGAKLKSKPSFRFFQFWTFHSL